MEDSGSGRLDLSCFTRVWAAGQLGLMNASKVLAFGCSFVRVLRVGRLSGGRPSNEAMRPGGSAKERPSRPSGEGEGEGRGSICRVLRGDEVLGGLICRVLQGSEALGGFRF